MPAADLIIIGAGAAGLAAAIFAGRLAQSRCAGLRILILDGAAKPGAKILISGGGRCNVTNERVTEQDYNGGPRPIIRNVLRAFDQRRTLAWMRELGVELKLEPTGKYFPASNQARTVLDALLRGAAEAGAELLSGMRVRSIRPPASADGFEVVTHDAGSTGQTVFHCRRLIIATGGLSIPKSGSDGAGLGWLRGLGHAIVPTTPALSPLLLRAGEGVGGRFAEFSGLTLDLRLSLVNERGRILEQVAGSTLFTHFGLSGPAPLNISRHLLRARLEHPGQAFTLCLGHPAVRTPEEADGWLRQRIAKSPRMQTVNALRELYPERLAMAMGEGLGPLGQMTREQRLALAGRLAMLPLDCIGDRGYGYAEVTAGGVELREIDARTMESRIVPGLHLCGELLDVDGRIGGFNFQWAWASGHQAGRGAVAGLIGQYVK